MVAARDRRYRRALVLADVLSAFTALLLCSNILGRDHLTPAILLGLPLVVLASKMHGLYDRDELLVHKTTAEETPALFHQATVYTLVVWVGDELLINGPMGSDQALFLWGSLFALTVGFRRAARLVAGRTSATERLLLIGDPVTYKRLSDKLAMDVVDARLVGRMSLLPTSRFRGRERPVDEATLGEIIAELDVHRVLVVPNQSSAQVTLDVVRAVKALGIRVSIVPQVFDVVGTSVVFDDISGMTILGVRQFGLSRTSRLVKRGFDLVGATAGLVVLTPTLAAIALLIKLDSRGPVFFRQERVGRDGHRFRIFKFRTMVADAESRKRDLLAFNEADGLFKMADDPRITRVGRFLRRVSIDELPQLLNVLRGEMSLVGPRPLILSEDETIKGYDRRRLHLTPGMTGHWQIMGSSRVPMHEMVKIDYLYVTTWSLFEDIKILARTVPYVLARRGL